MLQSTSPTMTIASPIPTISVPPTVATLLQHSFPVSTVTNSTSSQLGQQPLPSNMPLDSPASSSAEVPHSTVRMNCDSQRKQQLTAEQVLTASWQLIKALPVHQQKAVLSNLFDLFVQASTTLAFVPNFIEFTVNGMTHLKACGRSNVIYLLAKSLGTLRPDGSDSLLPARRMPMGLIEYCINFFNATSVQQVSHTIDVPII